MTRIVSGAARGRRLHVPPGTATRPTSDRAREALFSTLTALRGSLAGARVVDLYAGSGALGLEALSRGARAVAFVECDAAALRCLRRNLAELDLPGGTVHPVTVERWSGRLGVDQPSEPFDLVLADPPYALADARLAAVLRSLRESGTVQGGGLAALERESAAGADFPWPAGWAPVRGRRYGRATLWYGRAA